MAYAQQQQLQQQRWLRDMGLPPHQLELLTSHNISTARDLLTQSALDLVERLNITLSQAQQIIQHVAIHIAPPFSTALELHNTLHLHSVKLLTGLQALDDALRIGVPPAAITELVGPAGVGKSQFCYTLALQVALPRSLGGLGATLLYLDTEGKFSSERLMEMVAARLDAAPDDAIAEAGAEAGADGAQQPLVNDVVDLVLNRVLVVRANSPEELQTWLSQLTNMIPQRDIKLVVLDSVAALLRIDFGGGQATALAARGELLGQQAATLKTVAEANRIPVVVTNQVTARMTGPAVHTFQHQQTAVVDGSSTESEITAALGTKWAHAVNVRLVLERRGSSRFITIAKSPLSANVAVEYSITPGGVQQQPHLQAEAIKAPAVPVAPSNVLAIPIANVQQE